MRFGKPPEALTIIVRILPGSLLCRLVAALDIFVWFVLGLRGFQGEGVGTQVSNEIGDFVVVGVAAFFAVFSRRHLIASPNLSTPLAICSCARKTTRSLASSSGSGIPLLGYFICPRPA